MYTNIEDLPDVIRQEVEVNQASTRDEELSRARTAAEILEIKMELAESEPDALYAALHEARDLTRQYDEATSKLAWVNA